jgi:hypothetical protein
VGLSPGGDKHSAGASRAPEMESPKPIPVPETRRGGGAPPSVRCPAAASSRSTSDAAGYSLAAKFSDALIILSPTWPAFSRIARSI